MPSLPQIPNHALGMIFQEMMTRAVGDREILMEPNAWAELMR